MRIYNYAILKEKISGETVLMTKNKPYRFISKRFIVHDRSLDKNNGIDGILINNNLRASKKLYDILSLYQDDFNIEKLNNYNIKIIDFTPAYNKVHNDRNTII